MRKEEKEEAVRLRKEGCTYTEIATIVPVSKATLSGWLSQVPVPKAYYEKLRQLKLKAREKGWEARRNERITRTMMIVREADIEAQAFMTDPSWLVGLTLYWAEGSKEKAWGRGVPVTFTNMDVDTIRIFKEWCRRFLHVQEEDFSYSLYVHDTQSSNSAAYAAWWGSRLGTTPETISIYYKRSKITHVRKNDGDGYRGVFRLQVRRSVDLNRRIGGWISGMIRSLKGPATD